MEDTALVLEIGAATWFDPWKGAEGADVTFPGIRMMFLPARHTVFDLASLVCEQWLGKCYAARTEKYGDTGVHDHLWYVRRGESDAALLEARDRRLREARGDPAAMMAILDESMSASGAMMEAKYVGPFGFQDPEGSDSAEVPQTEEDSTPLQQLELATGDVLTMVFDYGAALTTRMVVQRGEAVGAEQAARCPCVLDETVGLSQAQNGI